MQYKLTLAHLLLLIAGLTSCTPAMHQERGSTSPRPSSETVEPGSSTASSSSAIRDDGSSACLVCHTYGENHHPMDFVPADKANFPFPLYNGRVKCLTCHTENHMGDPFMLRSGPYSARREFCFKCHYEEEYRHIYPHIMLDGEGKVIELDGKPVCLVCHIETPDPRVDKTEDVKFRADVAFLCWRCHSLMARAILNQHVLLKPSLNMLRHIEHNEQTMKVTIPLVPRERITCSTCHNPHQKGVIIYEPAAKGADTPDRLRLGEPALCTVCHKM